MMNKSKNYRMGIIFDFMCFFCFINFTLSFISPSHALDCPSPAKQLSPEVRGKLQGQLEGIVSKIISGSLSGDVSVEYKNLFEKYPNADKLVMAQNVISITCQFINESNLPDAEKLDWLDRLIERILRLATPSKSEKPIIPRFSGSVGHHENSLGFLNFLFDKRDLLVHLDIYFSAWAQSDLKWKKVQGGRAPYLESTIVLYVRHLEQENWRLWNLDLTNPNSISPDFINSNCEKNYRNRAQYYNLSEFYRDNPDLAGCTFEVQTDRSITDFSGGDFHVRGYFTVDYVGYRRMDYSLIRLHSVSDADALSLGRPR